ncbi:MAG: ParB/RepB/Spo0J family partition protein [Richelia sp. RM2_1_2]|nr:ParB/RepB/Spo0J family partition protein [Richelia sp. RM2_1_2]
MNKGVVSQFTSNAVIPPQVEEEKAGEATDIENTNKTSNTIPLSQIKLPSSQPRKYFDQAKLESLAASIRENGVLEPLLVRAIPETDDFELIAGERRYRAAEIVKLTEVPVVVLEVDDNTTTQIRLIENLQREDLNPLEETEGILELLALRLKMDSKEVIKLLQNKEKEQRDNPSHNVMGSEEEKAETEEEVEKEIEVVEEVFAATSRMSWKSFVKNRLPLLNLPEDLLEVLRKGEIEYTKAKELNKLKNDEARKKLLQEAIKDSLSLEQIRQKIKELQRKGTETENSEPLPLKQQVDEAFHQLKKSKVWDDKKKAAKLKKLLKDMQELMKEKPLP